MKRLEFELYGTAWKNRILVDGEALDYVTGFRIDVDPKTSYTRVAVEYFPHCPRDETEKPIRLGGYVLDTQDPSELRAAGLALLECLDGMPLEPLPFVVPAGQGYAWLGELRDWAASTRRMAHEMIGDD